MPPGPEGVDRRQPQRGAGRIALPPPARHPEGVGHPPRGLVDHRRLLRRPHALDGAPPGVDGEVGQVEGRLGDRGGVEVEHAEPTGAAEQLLVVQVAVTHPGHRVRGRGQPTADLLRHRPSGTVGVGQGLPRQRGADSLAEHAGLVAARVCGQPGGVGGDETGPGVSPLPPPRAPLRRVGGGRGPVQVLAWHGGHDDPSRACAQHLGCGQTSLRGPATALLGPDGEVMTPATSHDLDVALLPAQHRPFAGAMDDDVGRAAPAFQVGQAGVTAGRQQVGAFGRQRARPHPTVLVVTLEPQAPADTAARGLDTPGAGDLDVGDDVRHGTAHRGAPPRRGRGGTRPRSARSERPGAAVRRLARAGRMPSRP